MQCWSYSCVKSIFQKFQFNSKQNLLYIFQRVNIDNRRGKTGVHFGWKSLVIKLQVIPCLVQVVFINKNDICITKPVFHNRKRPVLPKRETGKFYTSRYFTPEGLIRWFISPLGKKNTLVERKLTSFILYSMHECALRQANSKAESTPLSWGFGDKTLTRIPAVFFPKWKLKWNFQGTFSLHDFTDQSNCFVIFPRTRQQRYARNVAFAQCLIISHVVNDWPIRTQN